MADRHPAALSCANHEAIEPWLIQFDQAWHEGALAAWVQKLSTLEGSLRPVALIEMVKIDLERQWQHGRRVSLESYLATYPELGTPETVAAELIFAEYQVRRQFAAPADMADFAARFPFQSEELRKLVIGSEATRSAAPPAASPERSQAERGTSRAALTTQAAGPAGATEDLPEWFGRYRILRKLGQGGMGSVYLAHDSQLDRQVALKVPRFSAEDSSNLRERFLREARAAATLRHPNICPVYDAGEIGGVHYLTMAYIEGHSLSDFIRPDKPLPQRQVAAVVRKLALALQDAHDRGIIHRDLKPSNVMIDQRHEPVVMDFGLARRMAGEERHLTETGAIVGTPAYMSPEQILGKPETLGPACDLYSLGVILYELLAGRLPFQGSPTAVIGQILTAEPEPPETHRPDLDPRLAEICRKAIAKQPEDRYPSMKDLAAALADYLAVTRQEPGRAPARPSSEESTEESIPVLPGSYTEVFSAAAADKHRATVARTSCPRTWRNRLRWAPPILLALAAAGAIVLGVVFYVNAGGGTVKIELSDPAATVEVRIDGDRIDVAGLDEPLSLRVGPHELEVTSGNFKTVTKRFTVYRGKEELVRVSLEPKVAAVPGSPRAGADAPRLAIAPFDGKTAKEHQQAWAGHLGVPVEMTDAIGMQFVLIPPGEFLMGDAAGAVADRRIHRVRITRPFYLGRYEVTVEQFRRFVDATGFKTDVEQDDVRAVALGETGPAAARPECHWRTPGFAQDARHPVVAVSFRDAESFCQWLSGKNARTCRLPTEAEWEYACRAGTTSVRYWGEGVETVTEFENVLDGSLRSHWPNAQDAAPRSDGYAFTAPVGHFRPNPFGLYDMLGNAAELCADWYGEQSYREPLQIDPVGPSTGTLRMVRGGAWNCGLGKVRSAKRFFFSPTLGYTNGGFRVVCEISDKASE